MTTDSGVPIQETEMDADRATAETEKRAVVEMTTLVRSEVADHIGVLYLDNGAKRNALSHALLDEVMLTLEGFKAQGVRVVILRAAPEHSVWSSGHDIRELRADHGDPLGYANPLEKTLRAIRAFPAPIIAMVHGTVWGGAVDLVLSCDMIVADDSASFAITPVNIGLPYNTTGLLHFLGRLPLNLIKEMFFTAAPIKAEEASRWGLVNYLVKTEELESFTHTLATGISMKAPLAIAVVKEQLRVLTDFQPIAAQVFERIQDMRREVFDSKDFQEGLQAFTEKRKPVFKGE